MKKICETERLYLREFVEADAPFIVTLTNTDGWLKYIGDRNTKTEELAKIYLQNGPIQSYASNGFGLWMVVLKANNIPIGMCGIVKRHPYPQPDIGFAFLPEYSGKGFATESANATLWYAKTALGFTNIVAIVMPENTKSIQVLEKIGLQLKGSITLYEKEKPLLLFQSTLNHIEQ